MKIAIAGTGYVGLVTGVCLAEKGHNVICVDKDKNKIEIMKQSKSPIYEKDLEELMKKNFDEGRLDYTDNYQYAYRDAEVIIIGVGTPENEDGSANLNFVYQVANEIAESVERDCIIVVKSTVPIGTNKEIEKWINAKKKHPVNIEIVSNPEFLSQGTAVNDTLNAFRIIIGTNSKEAESKMLNLYKDFNCPILITSRESAEMIKYASNAFLALKISYINEIANLCELVGANIDEVVNGMGYDKRIGSEFLSSGIGYGGSCFPKDTMALCNIAKRNNYQLNLVEECIKVNERQHLILLEKARKRLGTFENKRVAILGLTFKPGTDDLRKSPALHNIQILLEEKAIINVYDPVGIENCKKIYADKIKYFDTPEEALKDADICFVFTEWKQIKDIDAQTFKKYMKVPIVYDGRNIYSQKQMKNIEYYSIGRGGEFYEKF